MSFMTQS
jgi:hypothetical protein